MNTSLTPARAYRIRRRFFLIGDHETEAQKKVDFHVRSGEYFAMLSTMMGLLEDAIAESIRKSEPPPSICRKLAQGLREDLLYAHRTYRIVPKARM